MIESIYYMSFSVKPTKKNEEYENIESVTVSCWIKGADSDSTYIKATFQIEKFDWKIEKNVQEPIVVNEENFEGKEIGLNNFKIAKKEGMAFVYVAVSKDGKTNSTKKIKSSYNFDLSKYLLTKKEITNEGRCLHYQADNRCNEIIKAHSIQNNGVLSEIAREHKVYCLSHNIGDLKKNNGEIILKKEYIKNFSIFRGFCKKHDNKLFEPIDNSLFSSDSKEQIFLYTYRSLSKELFDKENALNMYLNVLEDVKEHEGLYKHFASLVMGTENGYRSLKWHKDLYDNLLKKEIYREMRYVSFNSNEKLNVVFSNVLYPEYDFSGELIQDLTDMSKPFDLISFYSSPTKEGWSFVFSWHKSSNYTCFPFVQSLKIMMKKGESLSDLLFQFVITHGENFAFSPDWWESLSKENQQKITKSITHMMNPTDAIRENYIENGLKGIVNWNFETVSDNLYLDSI